MAADEKELRAASETESQMSLEDMDLSGLPPSVAYDLALTEYASNVPAREQVPSAREQARGVEHDFQPAPPPPKLERLTVRKRLAAGLRKLDPRDIAGGEPKLPLITFGLLSTVGQADNQAFMFLIIFIAGDFGQDLSFVIRINSVLAIASFLMSPLGGYLADRVKRVWMVRIGAVIDNGAGILTGLATGVPSLVGSRILSGLGPAISGPALPSLMADYYPVDKRIRVFGFVSMVGGLFSIASISFLLFGFNVLGWTWRGILIATGSISLGVSLLTFFVKEPIRGKWDRLAMGASKELANQEQKPVGFAEAWRTTAAIGTMRKFWYATPFTTVASAATILMFAVVQEKLQANGGPLQGGVLGWLANPANGQYIPMMLIGFPIIVRLALVPYATAIADKLLQFRPGRILYLTGLIQAATAVLTLVVVLLPPRFVLLAFVVNMVSAGAASLVEPARLTLMSLVVPARIRGQAVQTIAPWILVGQIVMLFASDFLLIVSPTTVFLVLTPIMLIGALILTSSGANVERDMRSAIASALADEDAHAARLKGQNKMILARDVDVHYDGTQVLFNVDLDVDEGEILALLGTNGAGKSTLLRAISGIQEPSAGAIFLDGADITHKPPHLNARDGIVFLPGGRAVFPTLTVAENLTSAAWLYAQDHDYVRDRTEEILELFPILRQRLHDQAGNLSGGEQQMLGLGQAFLMKPRLLMIDELSLGLAPAVVEQLLDILRSINAQGTTVILVEQSVNVALTIATRAVFLDKGEIRFDGPTTDLLARGDLVRAVFLGSSTGGFVGLGLDLRTVEGAEPETALDVQHLAVSYGGVRALDGASLNVEAGEIVGVIGPNGAGKTTMFDIISGFTKADAGVVSIAGVNVAGLSPDARAALGLARSFQDTKLFPSLTVRESIAVALEKKLAVRNPFLAAAWTPGARRSERRAFRRVDYLVDLLGLAPFADKFINELSTGSRRIVDLACIMAAEPKILLLDEPSSGMAQAEIEVLGPVVQRLAKETGCGVLVIEHDMPLITAMSDRLVAMELGKVLATGAPEEVMADPRVLGSYLSASQSVLNRSGAVFGQALDALGIDPSDLTGDDVSRAATEQGAPS